MLFDVFISHASEDKEELVRPLAERLQESRIEVWYDEFSLVAGDSLRRSLDRGLSKSRYGIVVISPHFIDKEWPQWELDGLVQRQVAERCCVIIPIWHNVSRDDVLAFSPSLADKIAISSSGGVDHVVAELLRVMRPEGSTLLIARDRLLAMGCDPPLVTDDWWLDIVEFSASNAMEGSFQEAMGWGRWGFPLPPQSSQPQERGERLAFAAAQMLWQEKACAQRISQITHPCTVLEFIAATPGLEDACHSHPDYLVAYAPQLTIPGFGGPFEEVFDDCYQTSLSAQEQRRCSSDKAGTALTTTGLPPACDEPLVFRHPAFGEYYPGHIACWFFQGEIHGPPVRVYDNIDYVLWLLSDQSMWLPPQVRQYLLAGIKEWSVWTWSSNIDSHSDFKPNRDTGVFASKLLRTVSKAGIAEKVEYTKRCVTDIATRFQHTIDLFGLSETADVLLDRFVSAGFVEYWQTKHARKKKAQSG